MALAPGSNLGPYRIIEPLGKGGMASVYKAYEAALDRYVALKVLPGEFLHDESFAERFHREAKVIARLEHPHIVPIHAFGIERGAPWMAMRLISGGSLSATIHGKRIALTHVVALLRGVAEALDYAHAKGVIHRDVKPQNVLLDEAQRVYLADFGIARMVEGSAALTQTGMISGTPQYMAPEQAMGQPVDHRVDIYALGIVAYEMLMGRVPFAADTPVAVLIKHVQEPMPLPGAGEVSEPVARALLKCVAKKPEDRWTSAGAFVQALDRGMGESSAASLSATGTVSALRFETPPGTGVVGAQPTVASGPSTGAALRSTMPPPPPSGAALPVVPPPPPVPVPRPAASRGRVAAGIGAVVVLVAGGYFASQRPTVEAPEPSPSVDPGEAPEPVASPEEVVIASRPPQALPAADEDRTPADHAADKSRVLVDFEHPLKTGSLSLWVDEDLVLNEKLGSRVSQNLVAFKLRKGRLGETLQVSPGNHTIKVQVKWDDNVKTETIGGVFRAGASRRLQIRLGRIRKNLSLEWS